MYNKKHAVKKLLKNFLLCTIQKHAVKSTV